jgi:transposase
MEHYIGVDVSKHTFDVWIEGGKAGFQLPNTPRGIGQLANRIKALEGRWIVVCEPTGGYERLLVERLRRCNLALHVAHATRVRDFAKASGTFAKTDRIDARVLTQYARAMAVTEDAERHSAETQMLRTLTQRRRQLRQQITAERNRTDKALCAPMMASINRHIAWLEKEIAAMETQLQRHLCAHPSLKTKAELLQSIPGVGHITAATVLAELPELTTLPPEKLVAMAGLAPFNRDSGTKSAKRFIHGGRAALRQALYMAALSASKCHPDLRIFYQRLRAKGKPAKLALIALARKLIHLLHIIAKRQSPWTEKIA